MKRLPKAAAAAVAVLGTTALLAAPTFADANHSGGEATVQLAHMGQGQGMGQGTGQGMGHGYGPGPGYGMGQGMMMAPGMMMGPGMMMVPGYGMAPGMMVPGYGMAPGMMGPTYGMAPCAGITPRADKDLDAGDVRASLERSLDWQGNKRLKVGEVTETDDDTVVAEIVTVDGSLVQRLEVDRHTGRLQQVN